MDGVSSKEQAIQLCQVSDFVFLDVVPRFNFEASKGAVKCRTKHLTSSQGFSFLFVQFCFNFNFDR